MYERRTGPIVVTTLKGGLCSAVDIFRTYFLLFFESMNGLRGFVNSKGFRITLQQSVALIVPQRGGCTCRTPHALNRDIVLKLEF